MSRSTTGATNNSSSSVASKKQDEKNLKALRELVALPHNKQCFDCLQRGPTYVNTTVGSFVCTSCSGRLRGLNPPHRLKSISMATFTNDEVELMRCRGNEYCRRVWMGKYDKSRASIDESSFKDETQMKDFMSLKYEKKRWYVNPTDIQIRSPNISSSVPEQPSSKVNSSPLIGYNNGHTAPSNVTISKSGASSSATSSKVNAESASLHLPPTSDPFGSPVVISQSSGTHQQPAFNANFADFNAFSNGSVGGSSRNGHNNVFDDFSPSFPKSITLPTMPSSAQHPSKTAALPATDKYSALKELDELFSSGSTAAATAPPPSCAAPIAGSGASSQASVAWGAAGSSVVNVPPVNQFFGSSPGATASTANIFASSEAGTAANAWSSTTPFGAGAGRAVYNPFTSPQPQHQQQFRAPQQTWTSHLVDGGTGPAASVINPFSASQSFAQHQPHHTESKAWNPFMNN